MLAKLIVIVEELQKSEKSFIAYHGSDEDFDKFDVGRLGSKRGRTPSNLSGFFFTDNKEVAQSFGKYVKTVRLSFKNPKVMDANGKNYSEYKHKLNDVLEKIDKSKYDGLIIKNYVDSMEDEPQASTQFVVFSVDQIK
jgi:hypothetical protein